MQQVAETTGATKRPNVAGSIVLWIIQVLLALLFLLTGTLNVAQIPGVTSVPPLPFPTLFMQFIGVIELDGALGLILPGPTRIGRQLTPLAALGLFLEMIGATAATLVGGASNQVALPAVVGFLCLIVAIGRRSWR